MGKKSKKKGGASNHNNGNGARSEQSKLSNGDPQPPQIPQETVKDLRNNQERTAISSSSSSSSLSSSALRVSKEQSAECGEAEGRETMGRFDEEKKKGFGNGREMLVAELVSEENKMPQLAPNQPSRLPSAAEEPQILPRMDNSGAVFSNQKTVSLQSLSMIKSMEGQRWAQQDGVESEIHQLREENINLRREVEELKDTIERLLLERQPPREEIIDRQTQSMQPWAEISSVNEVDGPPATVSDTLKESEQVSIQIEAETKIEVSTAADSFELQYPNSASFFERLIAENAELVEKINEQSALIDRLCMRHSLIMDYETSVPSQDSSSVRNDTAIKELITTSSSMVEQARPLHNSEPNEIKVGEAQIALSEEVPLLPARESRFSTELKMNSNESEKDRTLLEGGDEEEIIVEVDETTRKELKDIINEIEPVNESQPEHELDRNVSVASTDFVPLSEAPITGAPVRLFSFMVHFISGADLVKTGK